MNQQDLSFGQAGKAAFSCSVSRDLWAPLRSIDGFNEAVRQLGLYWLLWNEPPPCGKR